MSEPMSLEDFAKLTDKLAKRHIDDVVDTLVAANQLMDMLTPPGGFKRDPWYKRTANSLGDMFIRVGKRLGGSYDYD